MKNRYEIDQSGKIEQTSKDTVIAVTSATKFVIVLPRKIKKIIEKYFRDKQQPRLFIYRTFSAVIALLLYYHQPKKKVVIDNEYVGHERAVNNFILDFLNQLKTKRLPVIEFGYIGKSSKAHDLAAKVARDKRKPDKIIQLEEILNLLLGIKNDRVSAD